MENSLISQGVELMIYGMGTVVVFLALLVVTTTAMSKVIGRYFAVPDITTPTETAPVSGANKKQLLAVISAAIHQHRQSKK